MANDPFLFSIRRIAFFHDISTGKYVSANHQQFINQLPEELTRPDEAQSKVFESIFQAEDYRAVMESKSKFVHAFARKLAMTRPEEFQRAAEILSKSMGASASKLAALGFVQLGLLWVNSNPEFGGLFYLLAFRISFSAFWEDRSWKRVESLIENDDDDDIETLFFRLLKELKRSDDRWFRLKLGYVLIFIIALFVGFVSS